MWSYGRCWLTLGAWSDGKVGWGSRHEEAGECRVDGDDGGDGDTFYSSLGNDKHMYI